jgi:membrane protein DedA with SNARE-associated domain
MNKTKFLIFKIVGHILFFFTTVVSLYVIINDLFFLMNQTIDYYFVYFLSVYVVYLPSILIIYYSRKKLKELK